MEPRLSVSTSHGALGGFHSNFTADPRRTRVTGRSYMSWLGSNPARNSEPSFGSAGYIQAGAREGRVGIYSRKPRTVLASFAGRDRLRRHRINPRQLLPSRMRQRHQSRRICGDLTAQSSSTILTDLLDRPAQRAAAIRAARNWTPLSCSRPFTPEKRKASSSASRRRAASNVFPIRSRFGTIH